MHAGDGDRGEPLTQNRHAAMNAPTRAPRLLDRYREEMVLRHYALRMVLGGDVGSLEGVVRSIGPGVCRWYSAKMRYAGFSATWRAPPHWWGKFSTAVG
jgi:hypothetical protein